MQTELPQSEHFYVKFCHWLTHHQYAITAKEGVPFRYIRADYCRCPSIENAEKCLAEFEEYYRTQAAYEDAVETRRAHNARKGTDLLTHTMDAMDRILGGGRKVQS